MKKLKQLEQIINENIEYFWENDPILEHEIQIEKLWEAFKVWCIQNCKDNFRELEENFIEKIICNNFEKWKEKATIIL